MERMRCCHLALVVSIVAFFSADDGVASDLYAINSGGDGKLFLGVSQADGSTTTISNLAPGRSYTGYTLEASAIAICVLECTNPGCAP